jgi:hypothetical protein
VKSSTNSPGPSGNSGSRQRLSPQLLTISQENLPFTFKLGDFAHAFADHYDELTEEQRRRVLALAEEVLASADETARAAVATGFFEALLNEWDEGFDLQAGWSARGTALPRVLPGLEQLRGCRHTRLDEGCAGLSPPRP